MAALPDRWYFTKEQIRNSPSVRDGIDHGKELGYRQQCANLMQDMGQRLKVTQLVINTSIVYMHRFYMFHSFKNYHRNIMASCFLFLSAKVEEQPRKLEHVLKVADLCLKGEKDEPPLDPKSNEYMKLSQDLINNETVVLQTLGFELSVEHPHTYVLKCAQLVEASKDLAQTSYFLATNSLHLTTFSIQYKPTVVACICIYVSCKWANWEILESQDKKRWWEYIDNTVSPELLEELSSHFIKILDNSQTRLKKRITSGPMVYKPKKLREDGKPEEISRKHYNGSLDSQRGPASEHAKAGKQQQDMSMPGEDKSTHPSLLSRTKPSVPSSRGLSADGKDSRKMTDTTLSTSSKHGDQSGSQSKRHSDSSKMHRPPTIRSEGGDARTEGFAQRQEFGTSISGDHNEKSTHVQGKVSTDVKQKQHHSHPHLHGRSSDSSSRLPTPAGHSVISPSQKLASSSDMHVRHQSPLKRPRLNDDGGHSTSSDSHSKHSRAKHDLDGRRLSNHELHKHKHAKNSSHHRSEVKVPLSDAEKLKQAQHTTSHKPNPHKHSHSSRDPSGSLQRSSSSSKHSLHSGSSGSSRGSLPPVKSPVKTKSVAKKQKLESSDPLLPPPPPPPSFPNAILNTATAKAEAANMAAMQGPPAFAGGVSQYNTNANPGLSNMVNLSTAPNQYRDFFMSGLPDIPLTDLLPPPPPPSGGINVPSASPPPPPPPPRS